VRAADDASIPVAVCGEAAGDPEAAAVLVGLGVGELSMAPASLAEIDTMLARLELVALRELAAAALAAPDAATVRGLAARVLHSAAPRT
jgi:phosphoenolpyruvate-protein kinase (PTS system EI component)